MSQKNLVQKATCMLASCLDAVNIPYVLSPGKAPTVTVPMKNGSGEIVVDLVTSASEPETDRLKVLANEIISAHRPTADAAFHSITDAAGYGKPVAIDRGPVPAIKPGRKTNRPYGDDPDRVIFRENVFRNVVNPSSDVYKKFDPVITTCCRFFYMKNRDICVKLGYEIVDLKTYAQMWTANFWSTGRVLQPKKDENERLLYKFLRQRFAEFYAQLRDRRHRNVVHDSGSVMLGLGIEFKFDSDSYSRNGTRNATAVHAGTETLGGHADPFMHRIVSAQDLTDEDDERGFQKYKDSHAVITTTNPKKRAKHAAQLLEEGLATLPHEDLLENLERASKSRFLCPDTRKEALRQLARHQAACSKCTTLASVTALPLDTEPVEPFVVVDGENEDTAGDERLCSGE